MILVVDLSNNDAEPSWHELRAGGVAAVYLKATEGHTFTDPGFARWRQAAYKAGLYVGAYHFARPSIVDPAVQSRHFARTVGKLGARDLRPALDLEVTGQLPRAQLEAWARAWVRDTTKRLGVGPVFYSYPSFITDLHLRKTIGYGLWYAAYNGTYDAVTPRPWQRIQLHQFTDRGRVRGCQEPVDVSYGRRLLPLLAHPARSIVTHPVTAARARRR